MFRNFVASKISTDSSLVLLSSSSDWIGEVLPRRSCLPCPWIPRSSAGAHQVAGRRHRWTQQHQNSQPRSSTSSSFRNLFFRSLLIIPLVSHLTEVQHQRRWCLRGRRREFPQLGFISVLLADSQFPLSFFSIFRLDEDNRSSFGASGREEEPPSTSTDTSLDLPSCPAEEESRRGLGIFPRLPLARRRKPTSSSRSPRLFRSRLR